MADSGCLALYRTERIEKAEKIRIIGSDPEPVCSSRRRNLSSGLHVDADNNVMVQTLIMTVPLQVSAPLSACDAWDNKFTSG